jgi:hypothetical protein
VAYAQLAEAEKLGDAYGKVSFGEWKEMRRIYDERAKKVTDFFTFREDWQIINDGDTVTVDYGGSCDICGLSVEFKDEHPLYRPGVKNGRLS